MNDGPFDTVVRQTAVGSSRRASLKTLGAAGLLAMFARPGDGAAKKRKNKAVDRCKKQQAPCTTGLSLICQGDVGCLARVRQCCAIAGKCNIVGFFECLETS